MSKSQLRALRTGEGADLADLLASWKRALAAANKRPATLRLYDLAVRRFIAWRQARGLRPGVGAVAREDVQMFIAELLADLAAKSVRDYAACLKLFLGWCVEEGEIAESPMARVKLPHVVAQPPVILADTDLAALLRACEGRDFLARRDAAILRLLIATPLRRGGLAKLRLGDVDLDRRLLRVELKGGREYVCPFDTLAAQALDRYLRLRSRHRQARETDALWLGGRHGGLSGDGIYRMVRARAAQAGLGHVEIHPHLFRGTAAHAWLAAGGSEGALMQLAGWKDRKMLDRYTAGLAGERAIEEYRRLRPGERIK